MRSLRVNRSKHSVNDAQKECNGAAGAGFLTRAAGGGLPPTFSVLGVQPAAESTFPTDSTSTDDDETI
jgi:hypothetical protein